MGVYARDGARGRVYYVRYQIGGVRHREAAGPSKKLALDLLAKRRLEAAEGKILPRGRAKVVQWQPLADAWLADAMARKRSWKRDRTSLRQLSPWMGHRDLRAFNSADVDAYVAHRLRQRTRQGPRPSAGCVNRELSLLKSILRKAADAGTLPACPRIKLLREPPGRVPRLSPDQERDLVAACGTMRLRVLTLLAIESGCRLSEMTRLRWCDLDLDGCLLRVEQSKSGKRRDVPLTDAAVAVLRAWQPDDAEPMGYVLPTSSGRQWLSAERPWNEATAAVGLDGLHLHDLRHVYAGRMVERGVDLYTVAQCLGHESLAMVQRYAHLSPRHRMEAVRGVAPSTATRPTPSTATG